MAVEPLIVLSRGLGRHVVIDLLLVQLTLPLRRLHPLIQRLKTD